MSIETLNRGSGNVFGFKVEGKLTPEEVQAFLPKMDEAVRMAKKHIRLLIDVTGMANANVKSEWEIFEFLRKHADRIEYIAIVGAHLWLKVMSEVLVGSVFVDVETRCFKPDEIEGAWSWLFNAAHPENIPVRRVIDSSKGLFTDHASPDYI